MPTIYIAYVDNNQTFIRPFKVIKETAKQYKTAFSNVSKSLIGNYNSSGYGYGLSPEQALGGLHKYYENNIKRVEAQLVTFKDCLKCTNKYSILEELSE